MDGKNSFVFNQATIQMILQHYINDHLLQKGQQVTVTNVRFSGTDNTYTVSVEPGQEVKE